MQDTEHHEVNQVTVGVTDGDAKHCHHSEAKTGQQGVDHIQNWGNEQE